MRTLPWDFVFVLFWIFWNFSVSLSLSRAPSPPLCHCVLLLLLYDSAARVCLVNSPHPVTPLSTPHSFRFSFHSAFASIHPFCC